MSLAPGGNWVALIEHPDSVEGQFFFVAPIIVWKECGGEVVGLILTDWTGENLPYPVPAPNVFGFMRYAQVDENGIPIPLKRIQG